MPNDNLAGDRLQLTLARTTAAALAVSSAEGDVFGGLVRRLAEILEVDATMIAQFNPEQPGRVRSLATWFDGHLLQPFEYDLDGSPCRGVVDRESRFVGSGVHDEFTPGTLFHAQGFDSYAAHSMVDAGGRQLGLIVALHRAPMADRELTEALLQIFAVRATAELERRRVEDAARASEASYRSIFEATEDAIFVHDFDTGRIIDVNPQACRAYGYTRDELLATRISDVSSNVHPYTEAEAIAKIEQAKRGGPIRFEWHRRNKDGSLHWDEVVLKTALIGGTRRILAFTREITQRKEAEEALRLREEQYRAIFNASADALVLWDSQHRRVDVNLAYQKMYGWRREDVIGRGYEHPVYPPKYSAPRRELVRRALAGEHCSAELEAIRSDGTRLWTELHAIPFGHRGEPHVLTIARDITERRRAEEALQASEEQYRAIFNASADGMYLRDADFRIVDVNPAYLAMKGLSREELVGTAEVMPGSVRREDELRAQHARVLAGESIHYETKAWRADGTWFDAEVRCMPLQYRGQPHVLYSARDITDRRRAEADRAALEAQLQQAQKMEAIGHLTGGIAHDFNNILTSVMGYMLLASERPAAESDAKLQEHLEQAQLACRRARDLIRQMLTFSRGQRGAARPTAVRTLIEESARLLRAMMPATIDLVTRGHCEDAIAVVDPVQAQQILLNLCINARDAMNGAGRIEIECRPVELGHVGCASCRHDFSGRFIEVSVADSGSGIPAHVAERMFEPFYSTKEVGKGTGMGLAMVHGIVHDLGGHIVVDTGRKGTVFRVLLPPGQLSAEETATAARPSRERAQLSGRVLLVDDEISVLGFMRQLLESWGLQVVTTLHPDDALHWFSVEPENFDLVLTDQTMPGMTGIELARELKRIRPDLPILLYSGHGELLRVAPIDVGVLKVLSKPIDPAEMRAAMAQALDRSHAHPENRGQSPIS